MLIGYARVSTSDQSLDLQRDALEQVGCQRIFTDVASGAKTERPGLAEALSYAREGDILVVWKLDRYGRSIAHLIQAVRELQDRGVGFRSLHESIDTSSPAGKLVFHIFSALAEFERDLIRERTNAGLTAARARGRKGGRPRVLDDKQVAMVRSLFADANNQPKVICESMGISLSTLYRYVGPQAQAPAATPSSGDHGR